MVRDEIRRRQEDEDQIRYIRDWEKKKQVRDEEKANRKQRHKKARRRFIRKIIGGRRP
jgi:hypothetical protein